MTVVSTDREAAVGRIDTTLTITNNIDQARAELGDIDAAAVRSLTLDSVLVDTGATLLSLPADVIARLGLRVLKEVTVNTAMGQQRARIFQDARLTLMGRESTFGCLELPAGTQPLLGVIPMETLGIEPDLAHQGLRLLPDGPEETYILAM